MNVRLEARMVTLGDTPTMKGVTTKRPTKPERLLNEQMLPILEWAAEQ
jgi:hypothetical protein